MRALTGGRASAAALLRRRRLAWRRAWALVWALAAAGACGGKAAPAPQPEPAAITPVAPAAARPGAPAATAVDEGPAALPQPAAQPTDAEVKRALAAWKVTGDEALGFEVLAPPGSPKAMDQRDEERGLVAAARHFLFPDQVGMGQVIVLQFVGDQPFDVEAGLDGGCNEAVANIDGRMTSYAKAADAERPARQFQFAAKPRGKAIMGVGRAVATGPRTLKVALAMWDADRPLGGKLAGAFIDSFAAK